MASHDSRQKQYKNVGRPDELRRRRLEGSLELRKQKKEDTLMKRRNVEVDDAGEDVHLVEDGGAGEAVLNRSGPGGERKITVADCVAMLRDAATGDDREKVKEAVACIRRLLSRTKSPPVQEVIDQGLVQPLIQILACDDANLQFDACWALTNVLSGTTAQTQAVVDAGALPVLVQLLKSDKLNIAEQATWAVGNIVGESGQLRDEAAKQGALHAFAGIIDRINDLTPDFIRTLAWVLSNFCRHKAPPAPLDLLRFVAPLVGRLLRVDDRATRTDACWALSYMTDGPDEQIDVALQAGVLPQLVKMAVSGQPAQSAPSLRALGNIVTGSDAHTQAVVDTGFLVHLPKLFSTASSQAAKEMAWLASNVLAGTQPQVQAAIDARLLDMLVEALRERDFKVQFEASWALSNLCQGGTAKQIWALFSVDVLPPLVRLLKTKHAKMLLNMLDVVDALFKVAAPTEKQYDALSLAFEECGGVDAVEKLQEHENEDVYRRALHIVETHFADDEETKENAAPQDAGGDVVPSGGFAF